jgi:5-(carboxyamino)imidazole ribonucleotide synthase
MLGGGQLGRFFVSCGARDGLSGLGSRPRPAQPGRADRRPPPDRRLRRLCGTRRAGDGCAAISTEFENVPAGTLDYLDKFVVVRPSAAAVSVCQNRIAEKDFLRDHALPHADFRRRALTNRICATPTSHPLSPAS